MRDLAIVLLFALQHGADIESIRKALCCDSHGRALGPFGAALDRLGEFEGMNRSITSPNTGGPQGRPSSAGVQQSEAFAT